MIKLKATIAALERARSVPTSSDAPQLERTRQELVRLRERHGDNHPEVTRLRSILSNLEKQSDSAQAGGGRDTRGLKADNPAYLLIQAQIEALGAEERAAKTRREELKTRLIELDARLEKSPEVERLFLELARDRENTVARYREIKAKLMTAEVAQELEQARKSEKFSLIDPAQQPEKPKSPNRVAIVLFGVVLALLAGFGSVALRELLDSTVRNSRHLASLMAVPVLSAIPHVVNGADARRARRFRLSMLVAIAAGIPVVAAVVHLAWMPLDVLWYSAVRRIGNYANWP